MAVGKLTKMADSVVTVTTGFMPRFYVSDFYRYWHVLSDAEGLKCLREWRVRRFEFNIELLQNRTKGIERDY